MKNTSILKPIKSCKSLGGKANNLMLLEELNLNIPRWVVVPKQIMLNQLPTNLGVESLAIAIDKLEVPADLLLDLGTYFGANYKSLKYAVRSSADGEDGINHSFAGQFETKLNVPFNELRESIKEVWKSVASDHVLSYRKENNLEIYLGITVIIQEMIQPEISGVAFGLDPITGDTTKKVVSAVYGLGEGLVSGQLKADNYTIGVDGIEKHITTKSFLLEACESGSGNKLVDVEQARKDKDTLEEDQLFEINELLEVLNDKTGTPQDIEFAYANGELHVLQTRPVTTQKEDVGEYNLWDNSNIVESYPGITTPLTYTFINKMYEAVYKQLSGLLGVSQAQIVKHSDVFENTLGLVRGRVYYNLVNWYKMLAMVPGYSLNAEFMETMMGVKEKFELGEEFKMSKTKAWFRIIKMSFNMIKQQLKLPAERKRFQKSLNVKLKKYNALDFDKMEVGEVINHYHTFETTLLKEWKSPLVNDFFSMIWFGLLKKQCQDLVGEESNIHNDLLCGSSDIISVQPIRRTMAISEMIKADPIIKHIFVNIEEEEIWEELQTNSFPEIKTAIDNYLNDFGERCIGELKLETTSYSQEPKLFIKILKNYVINDLGSNSSNVENELRTNAETIVFEKLKNRPFKTIWFKQVLEMARSLVSNRENLRYERTRAFGVVRKMFSGIGRQYESEGVIGNAKDIFYLELHEILDIVNMEKSDVVGLINKRKAVFEAYALQEVPMERFFTYGTEFTDEYIYSEEKMIAIDGDLKGIGCCPGQIKAEVQLVKDPNEIDSLNGRILVTSSTDPGWVTLFPSASAIIVERGSLLSHSAIVAREMGIPCIVAVDGLLRTLKTGDTVLMDGSTGTIKVIK